MILMGAVLGGVTFLGYRAIQARRKPNLWKRVRNQARKFSKNMPRFSQMRSMQKMVRNMHMPEVHMPDVHMPEVHLPEVHMPSLRRRQTLMQRASHGFENVRDRVPEIHLPRRRSMALWESLPFLSLLPFLRKESRLDSMKKQLRTASKRLDKNLDRSREQVNKMVQNVSIKDAVNAVRPEPRRREVYKDTVREPIPGGQKETEYRKVMERKPFGRKETVYEKVEEHLTTDKR
jgi:hypothetical protein